MGSHKLCVAKAMHTTGNIRRHTAPALEIDKFYKPDTRHQSDTYLLFVAWYMISSSAPAALPVTASTSVKQNSSYSAISE